MVEEPPASAPANDLPADLAEQVAKLAAADPAVRFEAVDVLIESKNSKVLSHLVPLAKDPDAFVRRLTVEGLREFAQAEAVDALASRLSALRAISSLGDRRADRHAGGEEELRRCGLLRGRGPRLSALFTGDVSGWAPN